MLTGESRTGFCKKNPGKTKGLHVIAMFGKKYHVMMVFAVVVV